MGAKLFPRDHSRDLWAKLTRKMGFSATGFLFFQPSTPLPLFLFCFIFARTFMSIYNFSPSERGDLRKGRRIGWFESFKSFLCVLSVQVIWKNWMRNTIHRYSCISRNVESAMKFYSLLFVLFFYVMDPYLIEKLNLNFEVILFIVGNR